LNSQFVVFRQTLKSRKLLIALASFISVSLFLKAGFVSVAVIWFFALCVYNHTLRNAIHHIKLNYILLFPIFFFFLNLMWIVITKDPDAAFDLMLVESHLFLIPAGFLLLDMNFGSKYLHLALSSFALVCLIASVVCYANAVYSAIKLGSFHDPVSGNNFFFYSQLTRSVEVSPVYLSMFCNLAFISVRYSPFISSHKSRVAVLLYLAIFTIMISSTIGILSLMVLTAVGLLRSQRFAKVAKYSLLSAAGLIAILAIIRFEEVKTEFRNVLAKQSNFEKGALVSTIESRIIIWSSALETISRKPITGYGFGQGQQALEETYEKNGFEWGVAESLNAHNEFLSTMLDFGLPGLSLLVLMIAIPFAQAVKTKDGLAESFLIIMILFFLAETVLSRQKGVVFFSLFYSLFFNHFYQPRTWNPEGLTPENRA
jgi:O-antigen ligase